MLAAPSHLRMFTITFIILSLLLINTLAKTCSLKLSRSSPDWKHIGIREVDTSTSPDVDAIAILAQGSGSGYNSFDQQTPSYRQQHSFHQSNQPTRGLDLLKQVPTAYVGLIFVLLTWRSLGNYEMADQFSSGIFRYACVAPSIALLVANLVGFIVNMMKPMNFKNHLKFILALNIIREWIEMAYNVFRMITARNVSREVYFGRFFMNCWWSAVCMSYSKSRWVAQLAMSNMEKSRSRSTEDMEQGQGYYQREL